LETPLLYLICDRGRDNREKGEMRGEKELRREREFLLLHLEERKKRKPV